MDETSPIFWGRFVHLAFALPTLQPAQHRSPKRACTHCNNADSQHFRCGAAAASRPPPKPLGSEPAGLGPPRGGTARPGLPGPEPAGPEPPWAGAASARPEIIVEPTSFASLALGMFCHKKFIRVFKMGADCPFQIWGRFVTKFMGTDRPGDGSSRGRIVQGTDRPGDGSSRGRFAQGTFHPGNGSSWGRIVTKI
jgi:hypothetical protein